MTKKVLLINDTTNWYHYGCTATSSALKLAIEKTGCILSTISITETYKITGAPCTAEAFTNRELYQDFYERNRELMEAIRSNDILVINGEGTLHGLRQAPLSLLYVAFIAKKFLNKRVEIVNHSVYPQDDLSLDNLDITDIYKLVYNTIDYAAVREPESFELMQRLGVRVVQSFDCMPLYIREKYQFHNKKDAKTLLIAGSAAWLHLNILSSDRGNIEEFEQGLAGFIRYLDQMTDRGYKIEFLYGAPEYPAKDDREFMAFIGQRLKTPWTVIEAKSLEEWFGTIERATLLVSGRFHHTIAAACLGTSSIILNSNTPKIEGMRRSLGYGEIINYRDPAITEKLMARTEEIENHPLNKLALSSLCAMAANNFHGLIEAQTEWYTEDRIREVLNFFLPEERFAVIAQTQFEHEAMLDANLRAAVGQAMTERIAVLPINLHNNHWVGLVIRRQANGMIQAVYVDPTGNTIDQEPNAIRFVGHLQEITRELNPENPNPLIQVIQVRQQDNDNDCGPFTVDNLIRLAQENLDNLTTEQITQLLYLPEDGQADTIRIEHLEVVERNNIAVEYNETLREVITYGVEASLLGEQSFANYFQ